MKSVVWKAFLLFTVLLLGIALGSAQETVGIYQTKCGVCHGADGRGKTPAGQKLGVRDFHSPEVARESDPEMFEITKHGKNKMPKYDGKLTDDQIKGLIKYIRSLK
jgi:mono/diheme cytochrome c family protein